MSGSGPADTATRAQAIREVVRRAGNLGVLEGTSEADALAALDALVAELDRLRADADLEVQMAPARVRERNEARAELERVTRESSGHEERARVFLEDWNAAETELAAAAGREQRLRDALGPDAAGRPFAELLSETASLLLANGGGPLADCLAAKAADVARAVLEEGRQP